MPTNPEICNEWKLLPAYSNRPFAAWQRTSGTNTWAPPHTTDFGIMFLPFESIYGEVTRRAALLEQLQQEYHVIVTGPTTLAAILNSLQMGFRTLAIQKRSSEVWRILGGVKAEFEKFGGLLEKAQKNLQTANNQLEEVMGKTNPRHTKTASLGRSTSG